MDESDGIWGIDFEAVGMFSELVNSRGDGRMSANARFVSCLEEYIEPRMLQVQDDIRVT